MINLLYKQCHFEKKSYRKDATNSIIECMMITEFRALNRGTINLSRSKSCKVIVCQTLRMIPSSLKSQTIAMAVLVNAEEFYFRPPNLTAHKFAANQAIVD